MSKHQDMVREFHEAIDHTVGDSPKLRDRYLRAKLIFEEALETIHALGCDVRAMSPTGYEYAAANLQVVLDRSAAPSLVDAIDGLCDLLVVAYGTAVSAGVDLDPHFAEVHRANMDKRSGPVRADGKQLKPPGWRAPDHKCILARQEPDLPRLHSTRILWETNRYDGAPLCGVAHTGKQFAWFGKPKPYLGGYVYSLFPIIAEELSREFHSHSEFMRRVGTHTTRGVYGGSGSGAAHSLPEGWRSYYDDFPVSESIKRHWIYESREPIGTFTWGT